MPTLPAFLDLARPLAEQSALGLSVLFMAAMLVFSDWRLALMAYGGLKVLAGILLTRLLPPEWALLQWVVGGLVGVMWFLSSRRVDTERRRSAGIPWWRPQWQFNLATYMRLALLLLLILAVYVQRPVFTLPRLPVDLSRFAGFAALAGLLGLGLGDRPLRWGLSLSMWLLAANFAIHALEVDANIVGLLASLELLLGFAISYLIVVDGARLWAGEED